MFVIHRLKLVMQKRLHTLLYWAILKLKYPQPLGAKMLQRIRGIFQESGLSH